jgi:polyhydroxyalkanoate synthase
MALEGWISQMSFAGLMASRGGWPSLSPSLPIVPFAESLLSPLRTLLAEIAAENPPNLERGAAAEFQPAPFIDALAREANRRMETFVQGVRAYQAHPYQRTLSSPPSIWRRGAAALIDYGGPDDGMPVLFVPSLVNRAYILDLVEDRSMLRTGAKDGLRVFLLDWGDPGEAEQAFSTEDYIEGVLIPALEEVTARCQRAPRLVGYCMGGTLSVAPAVLRPGLVSGLALLAAPWNFHTGTEASRVLLNMSAPILEVMLSAQKTASVDMLQGLFASLDPTLVGRKFRRFAALDPASVLAERFVALEDWLNDGVPLSGAVAREVFFGWYGRNDPFNCNWRIGGTAIDPCRITCPTLAFIPSQDRIVPPDSARALADAIPSARTVTVDLGHIGMMAAAGAPERVYAPLIAWLKDLAVKP